MHQHVTGTAPILSPQTDGKYQLIIWKGTEKLIVNGWKAGDLNISGLNSAVDFPVLPTNTPAGNTIQGDFDPIDGDVNTAGIQFKYDALGNVIGNGQLPGRDDELFGSAGNDKINGLGGNDTIDATNGGNDIIDGGAGRDFIYAGNGTNRLYGGADADAVAGENGKDVIFGDAEITDIAAYIQSSRSEASINEKGIFWRVRVVTIFSLLVQKMTALKPVIAMILPSLVKATPTYRLTNPLS